MLLRGEECALESAQACRNRSFPRSYSEDLLVSQEHSSTKYPSDLDRHKQVALGF